MKPVNRNLFLILFVDAAVIPAFGFDPSYALLISAGIVGITIFHTALGG
ncbi:MAG TPA: hypothetical protein VKZ51_10035 [Cyclobacteriaceae bacterium]|nr:hypothetical protein [Cyclobacteriaceae bacterium]